MFTRHPRDLTRDAVLCFPHSLSVPRFGTQNWASFRNRCHRNSTNFVVILGRHELLFDYTLSLSLSRRRITRLPSNHSHAASYNCEYGLTHLTSADSTDISLRERDLRSSHPPAARSQGTRHQPLRRRDAAKTQGAGRKCDRRPRREESEGCKERQGR